MAEAHYEEEQDHHELYDHDDVIDLAAFRGAKNQQRGYNPRLLYTSTRVTRSVNHKRLLIY